MGDRWWEGGRMMYRELDGVTEELREGDAHKQADKGTIRQTKGWGGQIEECKEGFLGRDSQREG